jgi:predicted MPP superfamily phosphohydrolase
MAPGLHWIFPILATATLVGLPLYAWRIRGRRYALFGLVVLAFSVPAALVLHTRLVETFPPEMVPALNIAFGYAMAASGLHLASLVRARLRPRPARYAISIPGMTFLAAGALSGPWLLLLLPLRGGLHLAGAEQVLEALRWLDLVPLVVAALSLVTSLRLVEEVVRVRLGGEEPDRVARLPVERYRRRTPAPLAERPLRIVQVSDPHLGPWQSERRLQRRLSELVDHVPDLVLLTGDFLTMEGRGTPGALARALAPLGRARGRCFAIFGNHDHEAPHEVRSALEANGVRLLVDEEVLAHTPVGAVQIVGADYVGRGQREHLLALLSRYPRRRGHLRLLLLHDPRGFRHVPKGEVDLTLAGHTHGGQLGLVSFGLDWTVLARSRWPDHGLFGHGSNRLYVHRGTGFYGFPLRIGVPGESSLLELVLD